MNNYYQGKTVLITGASSGIGEALARNLAKSGAELILVARGMEALIQLKDELDKQCSVEIFSVDISDELAVSQLANRIDVEGVDILINNAGVAYCQRFEELFQTDFRSMIDINYLGQVWMTRVILPAMKANGSGQIVNVASMAGVLGIGGYTGYSASKFALVGFTESLRNELSGTGVKISLVLPSDVDTPQLRRESETKPAATTAVSGTIKPLSAQKAAEIILQGVAKGKNEIVVSHFSGKFLLWLCRLFPGLSKQVMDRMAQPHNH